MPIKRLIAFLLTVCQLASFCLPARAQSFNSQRVASAAIRNEMASQAFSARVLWSEHPDARLLAAAMRRKADALIPSDHWLRWAVISPWREERQRLRDWKSGIPTPSFAERHETIWDPRSNTRRAPTPEDIAQLSVLSVRQEIVLAFFDGIALPEFAPVAVLFAIHSAFNLSMFLRAQWMRWWDANAVANLLFASIGTGVAPAREPELKQPSETRFLSFVQFAKEAHIHQRTLGRLIELGLLRPDKKLFENTRHTVMHFDAKKLSLVKDLVYKMHEGAREIWTLGAPDFKWEFFHRGPYMSAEQSATLLPGKFLAIKIGMRLLGAGADLSLPGMAEKVMAFGTDYAGAWVRAVLIWSDLYQRWIVQRAQYRINRTMADLEFRSVWARKGPEDKYRLVDSFIGKSDPSEDWNRAGYTDIKVRFSIPDSDTFSIFGRKFVVPVEAKTMANGNIEIVISRDPGRMKYSVDKIQYSSPKEGREYSVFPDSKRKFLGVPVAKPLSKTPRALRAGA
jgi:hypothetical protein